MTTPNEESTNTGGNEEEVDPTSLAEPTPEFEKQHQGKRNMPFAHKVTRLRFKLLTGREVVMRLALQQLLAHADNRRLLEVLHAIIRNRRHNRDFKPWSAVLTGELGWRAAENEAFNALVKRSGQVTVSTLIMLEKERVEKDAAGNDVKVTYWELEKPPVAFVRIKAALETDATFSKQATDIVAKMKAVKAHATTWWVEKESAVAVLANSTYADRLARAKEILGKPWEKMSDAERSTRNILEAIVNTGVQIDEILKYAHDIIREDKGREKDREAILKVVDLEFERRARHDRHEGNRRQFHVLDDIARKLSQGWRHIHPMQFLTNGKYEEREAAAKRLLALAGIHPDLEMKTAKLDGSFAKQIADAKLSEPIIEEQAEGAGGAAATGP